METQEQYRERVSSSPITDLHGVRIPIRATKVVVDAPRAASVPAEERAQVLARDLGTLNPWKYLGRGGSAPIGAANDNLGRVRSSSVPVI